MHWRKQLETTAQRRARLNLSPEERTAIAAGELPRCPLCGGYHRFECPFAAEIWYDAKGLRRRVVFRPEFAGKQADVVYDDDAEEA